MDERAQLRVVLVGAGARGQKTYLPWLTGGADQGRPGGVCPVAVLDPDLDAASNAAAGLSAGTVSGPPELLPELLRSREVDLVVVASPDWTHAGLVLEALAHGCDVLVEKPLTTTLDDARAIVRAEQFSAGRVLVAHNLRFANVHRRIHDLIAEGTLGRITGISFDYTLNPTHGLSYFTRWHRLRRLSGGLEITKSCHHFDLISWWLGARPLAVTGALRRNFFLPGHGGVPQDSDIHDTVNGLVEYDSGAVAHYSLTGSGPVEGYTCTIRGTAATCAFAYRVRGVDGIAEDGPFSILLHDVREGPSAAREVLVPRAEGFHGGADDRMLARLLARRTGGFATADQAAEAIAVGEALMTSSRTGRRTVLAAPHRAVPLIL